MSSELPWFSCTVKIGKKNHPCSFHVGMVFLEAEAAKQLASEVKTVQAFLKGGQAEWVWLSTEYIHRMQTRFYVVVLSFLFILFKLGFWVLGTYFVGIHWRRRRRRPQQQQQQQPTRCLKASGGPVWNLCEKFRFVGDLPGIIEFFFQDFGLLLLLLQDGITALDKSIATAGENRKEGK